MRPSEHQLTLADTSEDELEAISAMENGEVASFILPYSLDRHRSEYTLPEVLYKTVRLGDEPVGFLILALDPDGRSVELRRIVISRPGQGFGTQAVSMVDDACRALGKASHLARRLRVECAGPPGL